ncbi:MAG: HAMP domain-containing protein [Synechococcus sp. ELA057]
MKARPLSLRLLLLGPLVLQMIFLVLVIGFVGYRSGEQEVSRLNARSQQRASEQVRDYLHRFLSTPQQVIRLMAEAVESGRLDPSDRKAVTRTLWTLHRIFPDAAYLNYGWANGDFIGLGQVDNTSHSPFLEIASASNIQRLEQYRLDGKGLPSGLERIKPFDDFRTDAWYSLPVTAGGPVWIPIYNWVDAPDVMALGAGMAIRRSGVLVGVAEIDTFLSNISRFLRDLPVAESGVIYIVEADGRLVADSSDHLPFAIINGQGQRYLAQQAEDPVIRASASALLKSQGSFRTLARSRQFDLSLPSGDALVRVDPFRSGTGLDWRIVIVMPESALYGNLRQEITRQLLVSLTAILISGASTLLVVQFVTRQLNSLVNRTDALAEGDLSQVVEVGSILEIASLATSFNEMAHRLRRSFATLRLRNREIGRLAEIRREQLTVSEHQLGQEVRHRERLERSLADSAGPSGLAQLVDPLTGLFSWDGMQRRLRRSPTQHSPVSEPLLALQLAVHGAAALSPDPQLLQRVSDWLEQLAAEHEGLAASLGDGRFCLLLSNVDPAFVADRLTAFAPLIAPFLLSSGIAWLASGGDSAARLELLAEAERALAESRAAEDDSTGG